MRVRTALVNPGRASGVISLFELAVERHLAWVVGVGHIYADLERVARKHGFTYWVASIDDPAYWVAVRDDLIEDDSVTTADGRFTFDATHPGLGVVSVGEESFEIENHDDRVTELSTSIVPIEREDFRYTEALYSIKPLN